MMTPDVKRIHDRQMDALHFIRERFDTTQMNSHDFACMARAIAFYSLMHDAKRVSQLVIEEYCDMLVAC
jgi:hypothetical protein